MTESKIQHVNTTNHQDLPLQRRFRSSIVSVVHNSSSSMNIPDPQTNSLFNESMKCSKTNKMIIHNNGIIILAANTDQFDLDFKNLIERLQNISLSVNWFTDPNQCIDYLTGMNDAYILMIIYNYSDLNIIPLINFIPQIHFIYLYHDDHHQLNNENYVIGTSNRKVKGIYHYIERMCYVLKQDMYRLSTQSSLSILSSNSNLPFDELDSSFMYTQLFKEILVDIKYDKNKAKADFIKYCRDPSTSIDFKSNDVDKFEREYRGSEAIWWYTKANFLYFNVNQALRTRNMKVLMKMGFFIQDLHHNIEKRYLEDNHQSKITVYRGQGLPNRKFEEMKKSKGNIVAFNCFLSTSINYYVAWLLADTTRYQEDMTAIIFEIEIDPTISSVPFISLEGLSNHTNEQEILFSMHSIFRIGDMKEVDERLWLVKLTATDDNDTDLKVLTEFMSKDIGPPDGWFRMALLMERMGDYDRALEIYNSLLEIVSDDSEEQKLLRTFIEPTISCLYLKKGDYSLERTSAERLLIFGLQYLPTDHFLMAVFHQRLAIALQVTGEYSASLENYNKALEIYQKHLPSEHRMLAAIYTYIGTLQQHMGHYSLALINHQKALNIQTKSLPQNHPDLAESYATTALSYERIGEYSTALSYAEQALEIQKKTLPLSHPSIGFPHNTIGVLHLSMGNYLLALSHLQTSLDIVENSLSSNHPFLVKIYNSIGITHRSLGDSQSALLYLEKAFTIAKKKF